MMFFGRKLQQKRDKSAEGGRRMDIEKDHKSLEKDHRSRKDDHAFTLGEKTLQPQPSAVNSSTQGYVVSLTGTQDAQHLWLMNLSNLPGEQKRFLTVLDGSTFFINYAQGDYPSRIDITVNEINGSNGEDLLPTHSIATLTPKGPAVAVSNPGGIVGYNIQYGLLSSTARSFDISNIPQLTFGVTVGDERTPASYPLMEAIVLDLQLTRVVR